MKYLFSVWPELAGRSIRAQQILLLSDFDGTLIPIMEKPEMVVLPDSTHRLLQSLADQPHITLGIISGRTLTGLQNKVNIDGIIYAGNHGFDIEGPGLHYIHPIAEKILPVFREIQPILHTALENIAGAQLEDKGLTLSIHYRRVVASRVKDVQSIVKDTVNNSAYSSFLQITQGKMVYEIRPAVDWDKGKAVRLIIEKYGKVSPKGFLPVFLGDDDTDEDGFQEIRKINESITVMVGEADKKSAAQYYLDSPDDVLIFLDKLKACTRQNKGYNSGKNY